MRLRVARTRRQRVGPTHRRHPGTGPLRQLGRRPVALCGAATGASWRTGSQKTAAGRVCLRRPNEDITGSRPHLVTRRTSLTATTRRPSMASCRSSTRRTERSAWCGSTDARRRPGAGRHGHGRSGAMTLRATTVDRGGRVFGRDVLVDGRVCDCCPTTAVRTRRGALVAYRDRSATEVRDISVARLENGRWRPGGLGAPGRMGDRRLSRQRPGAGGDGDASRSPGSRRPTTGRRSWHSPATAARRSARRFARRRREPSVGWTSSCCRTAAPWSCGSALGDDGASLRARRVFPDGRRGPSAELARIGADRSSGHPRVVRSGHELVFAWREPAPSSRVVAAVAGVPEDADASGPRHDASVYGERGACRPA